MSIIPKDLVGYAEVLLKPDSCEIQCRNVIGRAYYGAFLTAREAARKSSGESFSGASPHKQLVEYYKTKNRKVSNMLDTLRISRVDADYKINRAFDYFCANSCCKRAKKIIKEL